MILFNTRRLIDSSYLVGDFLAFLAELQLSALLFFCCVLLLAVFLS